jgi:hypothetical protein
MITEHEKEKRSWNYICVLYHFHSSSTYFQPLFILILYVQVFSSGATFTKPAMQQLWEIVLETRQKHY